MIGETQDDLEQSVVAMKSELDMKNIKITSATGGDVPAIQMLLADCHLPTEGLELLTDKYESEAQPALAPRSLRG